MAKLTKKIVDVSELYRLAIREKHRFQSNFGYISINLQIIIP